MTLHEKHLAKDLGKKFREITEDEVNKAMELADENHDGVISKEEMTHWVAYYMSHSTRERHDDATANGAQHDEDIPAQPKEEESAQQEGGGESWYFAIASMMNLVSLKARKLVPKKSIPGEL